MVGFKRTYSIKLLRLMFSTLAFEPTILLAISVLGIVISHAGAVGHKKCFPAKGRSPISVAQQAQKSRCICSKMQHS